MVKEEVKSMARVYPDFMTISKLRTSTTDGEFFLLNYLQENLDSAYEIFFNPYLDGDRPDIIILKEGYGAIIIEVKDWNLSLYSVDQKNKWYVYTNKAEKLQPILSPHRQAFKYKSNMFELHLPILGMKQALNNNFYHLIHPFVYFHDNKARDIHSLYEQVLTALAAQKNELNEQRKIGQLNHKDYDKELESISNKIKKIKRDENMSFSMDSLDKLTKKIDKIGKSILFSEEIYKEFKRRLLPSEWTYSQGKPIEFDAKQQKYTKSKDELSKIKGVAGCGKTSIIAARSINAYIRHNNVLILTFNITLKQLIRDKISHINYHSQSNVDINKIEITNYHNFFKAQLNNLCKDIEVPSPTSISEKELELFFDRTYKNPSFFEGEETIRYDSIFLDEIQDYEKEWITIIRDYFLVPKGEMVVFGDSSQNIYQRDETLLNKSDDDHLKKLPLRGFGRWEKLTKSYRFDIASPLVTSLVQFQKKFLTNRHDDLEILETKAWQSQLRFDALLAYHFYDDNKINDMSLKIDNYIKKYKIVPNDVTIISSSINILDRINDFFIKNEKTMTMFVTKEEREACKLNDLQDFEKIKGRKKHFFVQNSGLIKLSTIHSFKGMESKTVFCILNGHEEPEMVYTAITRAKENLVVFDKNNSIYANFFNDLYNSEQIVLNSNNINA